MFSTCWVAFWMLSMPVNSVIGARKTDDFSVCEIYHVEIIKIGTKTPAGRFSVTMCTFGLPREFIAHFRN